MWQTWSSRRYGPVGSVTGAERKVTGSHRERLAVVYLRQSSPAQVRFNIRSTERRYAFADEAAKLGWEAERILVVDGARDHGFLPRVDHENSPGR